MHYVYLLESVQSRNRHYVGETTDLRRRLQAHNAGQSVYTRDLKPWRLVCYLGFASQTTAKTFERYLKSGSGKTFLKRHFLDQRLTENDDHGGLLGSD
jgi:putative endonuclease